MNVIIHLGGTTQRAFTAAATASMLRDRNDPYVIFVSSEGDVAGFMEIYEFAGHKDKVIIDDAAWCTVTNFTHTYKQISKLKPETIWVVTSDFHMPRSKAIAEQVWGGRCDLRFVEHPIDPDRTEYDSQFTAWSRARAWIWRYTGILFYFESTFEGKGVGPRLGKGHALAELGISKRYWLAAPLKWISERF